MPRLRTLLAGLLLGHALLATGLLTASHSHAENRAADPAYYLVVQHNSSSAASSQTMVISSGRTRISTMQVGGGTSDVSCTRYPTNAEAEAVAADRFAGQTTQVVLAIDAVHALAQTAGVADDVLALLPELADAAICTP